MAEVHTSFSFHKLRKLRMYGGWIFFVVMFIFARSSDMGFLIGLPVVALGEILRIWSHGYLRKGRQLATSGPYAHVRNPLYLGNFLIGLGFCCIIWDWTITASFIAGFLTLYWVTVKGEEQRLSQKFGEAYFNYSNRVGRFIPRRRSNVSGTGTKFALHRVWGHGEHITISAIVSLISLLYIRQELYQQHDPISGLMLALSAWTILCGSFSILAMILRYRRGQIRRQKNA